MLYTPGGLYGLIQSLKDWESDESLAYNSQRLKDWESDKIWPTLVSVGWAFKLDIFYIPQGVSMG